MTDPSNAPNADRTICNVHSIPTLETEMTHMEKTPREQAVNHRAHSQCNCHQRQSLPGDYARYESLKAIYTASARTQEEYIAATERAKLEAEV